MILTINIANSHITLGCVDGSKVLFLERIFSNPQKTDLEYSVDILNAFRIHGIDREKITGSIISCVVPFLQPILVSAVQRLFSVDPLIVSASTQHLLSFENGRPEEIGPSLIVNAAAASERYGTPVIVIDLSTATTISVVKDQNVFAGASILPGMLTSLNALLGGAAQLTAYSFEPEAITPIGRTTEQSLAGGAIYGNAGMIDGILERMEKELDSRPKLVATGRLAHVLIPYCRHEITIDETLTVRGLALLYEERSAK